MADLTVALLIDNKTLKGMAQSETEHLNFVSSIMNPAEFKSEGDAHIALGRIHTENPVAVMVELDTLHGYAGGLAYLDSLIERKIPIIALYTNLKDKDVRKKNYLAYLKLTPEVLSDDEKVQKFMNETLMLAAIRKYK